MSMQDVFLLGCLGLVAYVYIGYPLAVYLLARRWGRSVHTSSIRPVVSVVIAARNEAHVIGAKITNCLNLTYPEDRLEVVVVSDGSTDMTPEVARRYEGPRVRVIAHEEPHGKAVALNAGVAAASGEVILFTDARQRLARDAAELLVACFADPTVGAVSGELILGKKSDAANLTSVGWYWRYEKLIRKSESALASTVGASGAIYAIRAALFEPLPEGTILDDVVIPLRIVMRGYRVVFQTSARAFDSPPCRLWDEFQRKARTLGGNFQLLAILPELLLPWRNPVFWQLTSHKLGRLVVPYALLGLFVESAMGENFVADLLFWGQIAAYGAAVAGHHVPLIGPAARTFLVINAAAVVGLYNFALHRRIPWRRRESEALDEGSVWNDSIRPSTRPKAA